MTREYIKLENEGKSFEELEYLTLEPFGRLFRKAM